MNKSIPHRENHSRVDNRLVNQLKQSAFKELISSLVAVGWDSTLAPIALSDKKLEDKAFDVEQFASEYDAYGQDIIATYSDEANTVKVTGSQVANHIRATYAKADCRFAVSGSRRSYALPIVDVIRQQLELEPVTPTFIFVADTIETSLTANLGTVAGLAKLQPKDLFAWFAAYRKHKPTVGESDLMRLNLSRGRAQQLIRAHHVDNALGTTIIADTAKGVIAAPHKERLQDVRKQIDNKQKRDARATVKGWYETNTEQRKAARADTRIITAAINGCNIGVVRLVLDAVNRNDLDAVLSDLAPLADKLNAIVPLVEDSED